MPKRHTKKRIIAAIALGEEPVPYHRLLASVLVSLALFGAACAAEEAAEPSGPTAATTTEGQPTVTAVEAEATLDVAPAAEVEASSAPEEAPEVESVTEPEATPEPDTAPEPEDDQSPSSVVSEILALLDALTVAAEHTGGYDRDLFRHWIDADGDGCDTRREVLLDEAVVAPAMGSRCSLSDGEWISRYDGLTDTGNGRGFDVDHLVPLAEAWESGAHSWTSDRREGYANDLGYENSLIAVSATSNRSKGARDPVTWLPSETGQHCWYAASWVHVKTRWMLTIDQAEANTLHHILNNCSNTRFDVSLPAPVVADEASSSTESPQIAEPSTIQPSKPNSGCHPAYSPCLPYLPGDAINCGDLTGVQKPVTVLEVGVDPYQLDRDQDGQGCTG